MEEYSSPFAVVLSLSAWWLMLAMVCGCTPLIRFSPAYLVLGHVFNGTYVLFCDYLLLLHRNAGGL
jgi:hypothetical protein